MTRARKRKRAPGGGRKPLPGGRGVRLSIYVDPPTLVTLEKSGKSAYSVASQVVKNWALTNNP